MAETPHNTNNNGGIPCILIYCENPNITSCPCLPTVDPYLLPPPPLPPPPQLTPPSSSHIAPFLIAIVCILGISFLLLTTCTIIFRYRFTRRRPENSRTVSDSINNHENNDEDDHSFVDHPIWYITTVGLQQSVIDSITAFKYRKIDGFFVEGSSDSSCSVCLTDFEDGDDLRMLPKCCHPFHLSCIDTWLRSHTNCPLCRAPVVNEGVPEGGDQVGVGVNSSGESQHMNLEYGNGGEGSSIGTREDDLTRLPVLEGIKIAEILRRNRELRIFSDLGDHRRFRGVEMVDYGVAPVPRSASFNGAPKSGAVLGASNGGGSREGSFGEGCSREGNFGGVSQQKNIDLEKGGTNKRGSSMSGLLIKSSSIGRSLQKGPVSMKRSLSSTSSRFFSFRRSKSQASVLPL